MPGAYCFFLSYDKEVSVSHAPIFVDSFFDGGGDQYPGQAPFAGQQGGGYRSAGTEQFAMTGPRGEQLHDGMSGRSLATVLRSEFAGGTSVGTGMIVPRATNGGVPRGMSPHFLEGVRVIVDPHIPHQRTELELGEARNLAGRAVQAAMAAIPNAFSVQEQRFRAAAAYRMIGDAEETGEFVDHVGIALDEEDFRLSQADKEAGVTAPQRPPRAPARRIVQGAPVQQLAPGRQAVATPVGQPQAQQAIHRPVRSLTQAAQQRPAPAVAQPVAQQVMQQAIPAPGIRVNFELQFFNAQGQPVPMTQEAYFHDVKYSEDRSAILLAWRQGCQAPKWLPPSGDAAPALALQIHGEKEAHIVSVLPISYVFLGYEITQLVISQSGPVDES